MTVVDLDSRRPAESPLTAMVKTTTAGTITLLGALELTPDEATAIAYALLKAAHALKPL